MFQTPITLSRQLTIDKLLCPQFIAKYLESNPQERANVERQIQTARIVVQQLQFQQTIN